MVVYDLRCGNEHVFEAWFPGSDAFDAQAKRGKVQCPVCGDRKIQRAPMAPHVSTRGRAVARRESAEQAMKALTNMQAFIEKNCDHVGPQFAEEARKIHYGETETRNIYGEATPDEAAELRDEGIEFGEIPWPVRGDA